MCVSDLNKAWKVSRVFRSKRSKSFFTYSLIHWMTLIKVDRVWEWAWNDPLESTHIDCFHFLRYECYNWWSRSVSHLGRKSLLHPTTWIVSFTNILLRHTQTHHSFHQPRHTNYYVHDHQWVYVALRPIAQLPETHTSAHMWWQTVYVRLYGDL